MTETNVITSTDVVPKKKPRSFEELNKEELVAAALSFGSSAEGTKAELKADLMDFGITWNMYEKAFGLADADPVEQEEFVLPVPLDLDDVEEVEETVTEIITAEAQPRLAPADNYLIRMVRENPYFEFKSYKFTQEKPYAIMKADDAQVILESEEGFRQAFPAELSDFYS